MLIYCHELYISGSGKKITGEERKYYKSTRDESFLKALKYDGESEVFLTKKMLWMMLTRINGEVAIKSAERYIERYSTDHDYHDKLLLLEVYYCMRSLLTGMATSLLTGLNQ